MYDFEILVPAETSHQDLYERLIDFKKFSLINTDGFKIKLIFACSPKNETDFLTLDWPSNIDVEVLNTPFKHVAQRICHYYAHHIQPNTAKWYMRIDEDSITDISKLNEHLNIRFDYEREYHIIAHQWILDDPLEKSILKMLGLQYMLDEPLIIEHEISITSQAAINRICKSEKVKKYFKVREQMPEGFGDRPLAICLAVEKVYGKTAQFISKDANILQFSQFGGNLTHIHKLDRKSHKKFYAFLDLQKEQEINKLPEDNYMILDKNTKNGGMIYFGKYNNILDISDKNLGLFCQHANQLIVFLQKYPLQFFDKTENGYESENLIITKL
jgi:hypothetical protein